MAYQKLHRRRKAIQRYQKYQIQQRVPFSDPYYDDDTDIDVDDADQYSTAGYYVYGRHPQPHYYHYGGEYRCESDDSADERYWHRRRSPPSLRPVNLKFRYKLLLAEGKWNNAISSGDDESESEVLQDSYGKMWVKKKDKSDSKETRLALFRKRKWINSWCRNGNNDKKMFYIHVDGFFRKNRKAGYGVIIQYHSGFPLVASVGVQRKPVSAVYHELQGVKRGLELAIKYGIWNVRVTTTSYAAANLVYMSIKCFHFSCYCAYSHNLSTLGTCERCVWNDPNFLDVIGQNSRRGVYPLLQEIVGKYVMFKGNEWFKRKEWRNFIVYSGRSRRYNRAADYLAKLQENKEEISPIEFPEELKDIIYKDRGLLN